MMTPRPSLVHPPSPFAQTKPTSLPIVVPFLAEGVGLGGGGFDQKSRADTGILSPLFCFRSSSRPT